MIFALLSALAVALNGLAGGYASRKLGVALVLAVAAPVSLLVAVGTLSAEPSPLGFRSVLLGLIAGISGGFGILMSYRALQIGPIGIAAAITSCTAVTVASAWGLATEGGASAGRLLAILLCLIAIGFVSYRKSTTKLQISATLFALGAGVIFGSFQVLMNATEETDGWWPLVMVRAGVTVIAWGFLAHHVLSRGRPATLKLAPWGWGIPALAGTMDALGNVFLILALRVEDLAVVAVVTSIAPAATALLGWLVLSERLSRIQVFGLAISIGALTLAAL